MRIGSPLFPGKKLVRCDRQRQPGRSARSVNATERLSRRRVASLFTHQREHDVRHQKSEGVCKESRRIALRRQNAGFSTFGLKGRQDRGEEGHFFAHFFRKKWPFGLNNCKFSRWTVREKSQFTNPKKTNSITKCNNGRPR